MAFKPGKSVSVSITDSGGTARDLSAYVTRVRMSLKGKGLIDVTAGGALGHAWASDELEDGSVVIDFLFDPTDDTGPFDALQSLRTVTAAKAFIIGPYGNTAGYTKINGTWWLEDFPLDIPVGEMIKLSGVSFKIEGAVTITTFSA